MPNLRQSAASGCQSALFVVVNFENFQKPRKLQDLTRGAAQPEQDEARTEISRGLEAFDQRSNAGTVNISDFAQVHQHASRANFADLAQYCFSNFGRICKFD